jgi:hypothetical protein
VTPELIGVLHARTEEEVQAMEVEEGAVVSQMEELENVSMEGAEAEGKGRYMMVV